MNTKIMYVVYFGNRSKYLGVDDNLVESSLDAALFHNFKDAREALLKEVDTENLSHDCYVCPVNVTVELAE